MQRFIITLLKEGTIAFLGCKLIKSLGQKEISEMISAGGIAVVGLEGVRVVANVVGKVEGFFGLLQEVGTKFAWIGETIKAIKS